MSLRETIDLLVVNLDWHEELTLAVNIAAGYDQEESLQISFGYAPLSVGHVTSYDRSGAAAGLTASRDEWLECLKHEREEVKKALGFFVRVWLFFLYDKLDTREGGRA
jgi:hypothetical protein